MECKPEERMSILCVTKDCDRWKDQHQIRNFYTGKEVCILEKYKTEQHSKRAFAHLFLPDQKKEL